MNFISAINYCFGFISNDIEDQILLCLTNFINC